MKKKQFNMTAQSNGFPSVNFSGIKNAGGSGDSDSKIQLIHFKKKKKPPLPMQPAAVTQLPDVIAAGPPQSVIEILEHADKMKSSNFNLSFNNSFNTYKQQ